MCSRKECSIIEVGYWVDPSKNLFTRGKYLNVEQVESILQSQTYVGFFKTVFQYDQVPVEEAMVYGDLYFDFDSLAQFDKAREDAILTIAFLKTVFQLNESQIQIFFSGSKGIHLIVPGEFLGIEPCKDLNVTYRYIAKQAQMYLKHDTLDLMIYDKKRLFRVPNTIHEKTGLHKISLTLEELRKLPYEAIKEKALQPQKIILIKSRNPTNSLAEKQYKYYRDNARQEVLEQMRKANERSSSGNLKCTPPCITHLMEQGAQEGKRNNSVAALASFYKSKGLSLNESIDILSTWNYQVNSKPLTQREIIRTCQSIFHGHAQYGCSKLKDLSVCDLAKCPLKRKTVNRT